MDLQSLFSSSSTTSASSVPLSKSSTDAYRDSMPDFDLIHDQHTSVGEDHDLMLPAFSTIPAQFPFSAPMMGGNAFLTETDYSNPMLMGAIPPHQQMMPHHFPAGPRSGPSGF
jgi:hypothetical protein